MTKRIGVGSASAIALALSLPFWSGTAIAQSSVPGASDPSRAQPLASVVDPFRGNLDPFKGNLDPFRGNLDPFRGNIDPFKGNIDPFKGNLDPFKGNIDPFAGSTPLTSTLVGQFWGQFGTSWTAADSRWTALNATPADPEAQTQLTAALQDLLTQSEQFWGARVQTKTGKSFQQGFADGLFAKHGISLNDPSSLARLSASQRSRLVFDWYDGLMEFTGTDHVDHWMNTVNWNPTLSKIQGGGSRSIIGIVDSSIGLDVDLNSNLAYAGGMVHSVNGHGAAVLSLIVADHDGQGVAGIAPNAKVIAYNPFDDTGTADWADIKTGIVQLKQRNASIINLSLGARGWTLNPDWRGVFGDMAVRASAGKTVYVTAAGNDGIRQTANVPWLTATQGAPNLIVVGSVDPQGVISTFSNTPGTACLTINASCSTGNRLADRFIVAPGELLLVADGNGGITRATGTSFAAPLVSGAITLIHDRWPWLVNYPDVVANIILSSARDLGAVGTDEVYGRGLLDVEASQSPLNFDTLTYREYKGNETAYKTRSVKDVVGKTLPTNWEADGVYYYLIEKHNKTVRDFTVPISTRLIGQRTSVSGSSLYFQSYVTSRLNDWIRNKNGFSDSVGNSFQLRQGLNFGVNYAPAAANSFAKGGGTAIPSSSIRFSDNSGRYSFSAGQGNGAANLIGRTGFGISGDYDSSDGGLNPVLGFASGGAFVSAALPIANKVNVTVGFTEARRNLLQLVEPNRTALRLGRELADYRASAVNARVHYTMSKSVTFNVDYARVREGNGLLGTQSLEASDLRNGGTTDTATLGAAFQLPRGFLLSLSATAGKTRAGGGKQALSTQGAVVSSAFAVSGTKSGIFGKRDALRLSLAQPLKIERGQLAFSSLQVIDRTTGELGEVKQTFDIRNKTRRLVGEALYAAPIFKNGELGLFGRAETTFNDRKAGVDGMVIGGRLSLSF
jgi:hypothetical protein